MIIHMTPEGRPDKNPVQFVRLEQDDAGRWSLTYKLDGGKPATYRGAIDDLGGVVAHLVRNLADEPAAGPWRPLDAAHPMPEHLRDGRPVLLRTLADYVFVGKWEPRRSYFASDCPVGSCRATIVDKVVIWDDHELTHFAEIILPGDSDGLAPDVRNTSRNA